MQTNIIINPATKKGKFHFCWNNFLEEFLKSPIIRLRINNKDEINKAVGSKNIPILKKYSPYFFIDKLIIDKLI